MVAAKNNQTLALMMPELVVELADPELAASVHYRSTKRVEWVCQQGHKWVTPVVSRTKSKGTGCPYCSNKKVWPGFNDLWTTEPKIAAQLKNPEDGFKFVRLSGSKVNWVCPKGHEWNCVIRSRSRGSGCPYCAGRLVKQGYNDLQTTHPKLFNQLVDKSKLISYGYGKKVAWKCDMNHVWAATPNNRTNNNRGCPTCDKTQTSRSEILLRGLLKAKGFDVNMDHTSRILVYGWSKKSTQVDIIFHYLDKKVVVEYDGSYWHKDTRNVDARKTNMLLENGYYVVRVVGQHPPHIIPPLSIEDRRLLQLETTHMSENTEELSKAVTRIISWLGEETHDSH